MGIPAGGLSIALELPYQFLVNWRQKVEGDSVPGPEGWDGVGEIHSGLSFFFQVQKTWEKFL